MLSALLKLSIIYDIYEWEFLFDDVQKIFYHLEMNDVRQGRYGCFFQSSFIF